MSEFSTGSPDVTEARNLPLMYKTCEGRAPGTLSVHIGYIFVVPIISHVNRFLVNILCEQGKST